MSLTLYYSPGSCALASHIALEEAGAEYELVRMNLAEGEQRRPEYLKLNPHGRVPTLVTERGVLTESPAILGYVAERFPQAKLAPTSDSFLFGRMQAFNMYLASTVQVAFGPVFRPARFTDDEAAIPPIRTKALQTLDRLFSQIEGELDGPWVWGDDYTVSDPYLSVFARWLSRDGMPGLHAYPRLHAHLQRVQARPAAARVLAAEGLQPI